MSYVEMVANINKRFQVLKQMTRSVIGGSVKSLIISGAPGVGKTYGTEEELKAAARQGLIRYSSVKGAMSAIGLFQTLYHNRDEDQVLVLDDIDSIFYDMEALNLLKAAVDTSAERIISWNKNSATLRRAEIPTRFEYKGRIIFVTNEDIGSKAKQVGKMQPHYKALMSRSVYLDLGIHTRQQILARIMHVVCTTDMLQRKGLNDVQVAQTMDWIRKNLDNVRELSLRTAIQIGNFIMSNPEWEMMAQITLLNNDNDVVADAPEELPMAA